MTNKVTETVSPTLATIFEMSFELITTGSFEATVTIILSSRYGGEQSIQPPIEVGDLWLPPIPNGDRVSTVQVIVLSDVLVAQYDSVIHSPPV